MLSLRSASLILYEIYVFAKNHWNDDILQY